MSAPTGVSPQTSDGPPEKPRNTGPGGVAPGVFYPAAAIIIVACVIAIAFPDQTGEALSTVQTEIVAAFGWYYVLIVAGFVGFAIWMGVSRFGDITLGKDEDEPEFSLWAWFAMLFAAGMGIGLVFWGAAEPLTFFDSPKPGVEGSGSQLAQSAMSQTFLHWGLHAWAIYVVVGLALAYAIHRKGRSVSLRWILEPLLGDRVRGRLGDAIDVVAIVGTLFGVATSLGLGVQQISAGLVHLGVVDEAGNTLLVVLIVVITAVAIASVVSGVGKGIKWLSNANLVLAAVFLLAVLALGPTLFLLREWVQSIGVYFRDVLPMTFSTSAFTGDEGQAWQASWTTFYWGWWISWAPFVGVFIARISRGRTIREFVAGVLLVPTLVTFLWFSVLGGSAIHRELFGAGGLVDPVDGIVSENVLFDLLGDLPIGGVLSVAAVVLVALFFVTSSDSGSLVVDMLASGGDLDPPRWSRVMWAVLEGLVAIALLLAGGLAALQTGAIITALPFSVIMVASCFATYKALRAEHRVLLRAERRQRREELSRYLQTDMTEHVSEHLSENFDQHFGEQVDERIEVRLGNGRDPGDGAAPPR
jgi:choline/glycine/proline betaine transport protein